MIGAFDLLLRKAGAVRFSVNENRSYYETAAIDFHKHMMLPEEWSNTIEKAMIETLGAQKDSPITTTKIFLRDEVQGKERSFTAGVNPALVIARALDRWRLETGNLDPITDFAADEMLELEQAMIYLTVESVSWYIDGNEHLRDGASTYAEIVRDYPGSFPTWVGEPVADDYTGDIMILTFYPDTPIGSYRMAAATLPEVLRAAHALMRELRGQ
ncbi:hypothetical protein HOU02_gp365 [Caulobacter phage CcrBL9]|uniref:Uncharacterized protein n=1 Tax=Caulobacter phage CcrBL9 TaxID=2283270 RepID=A0A385ECI4_9CAUD|nr:hypothetical protein HOU02_gp365 [Caulobacter phage CcrBL9]AXQ69360.1 hypothetical protein CcrBL9_gp336 [Caulobacter phage CcrBL9]